MPRNVKAETGLTLQEEALLADMATDIAAIRTALVAVLAKLDADAGVTDTNYAATLTPAALNVLP